MYAQYVAYRHDNGEVEGCTGYGFGQHAARADAEDQIRRKLAALHGRQVELDVASFIDSDRELTAEGRERIRRDWAAGVRYDPNGSPYRDDNGQLQRGS